MNRLREFTRLVRAFTVVEVLTVLTVAGIMAAVSVPVISGQLERTRMDEEKAYLAAMRTDIEASFGLVAELNFSYLASSTDVNLPLASYANAYDLAPDNPAQLSAYNATAAAAKTNLSANAANYIVWGHRHAYITAVNDWRYKLANLRQLAPVTGLLEPSITGNTLGGLVFNKRGFPRVLLAGPTNQTTQRYLLISYMGPYDFLPYAPTTNYTGIFEDWWNFNWGDEKSSRPSPPADSPGNNMWVCPDTDDLTGEVQAGRRARFSVDRVVGNGRTISAYMLVERIILNKYPVVVTHKSPLRRLKIMVDNLTLADDKAYDVLDSAKNIYAVAALEAQLARGVPSGRTLKVYLDNQLNYSTVVTAPIFYDAK